MKKRLVSGIQPTGVLHLGNYLGSLKNWVNLLNDQSYEALLFVANLHSMTLPYDPKALYENTLVTTATYLACGLDPKRVAIFAQSSIKEHNELAWILGCNTSMGWLNRMTQFKDKSQKLEQPNLGLYSYPVLMAADVLLYNADFVPVGEDQKQHVELMRDIAQAFNRNFAVEYFKVPEPLIIGEARRVMSLKDGTKKMSKSDDSDLSRINLTDSADTIIAKFKKAKTDSVAEIAYDQQTRPEVANLLRIYSVLSSQSIEQIVKSYHGAGFSKFKMDLADLIINELTPIGGQISQLVTNERAYLMQVLEEGKKHASEIAAANIAKIKEICGIGF